MSFKIVGTECGGVDEGSKIVTSFGMNEETWCHKLHPSSQFCHQSRARCVCHHSWLKFQFFVGMVFRFVFVVLMEWQMANGKTKFHLTHSYVLDDGRWDVSCLFVTEH